MISLPITWPTAKINTFCNQWLVTELSLFGSVLRDDFRPDSDVDILIEFNPNTRWTLFDRVKMQQELAAILHRNIDLVRKDSIEQSHNPIRRKNILSAAHVIYSNKAHARK